MQNEFKGTISFNLLGTSNRFSYRAVYGVQPHVLECYTNDGGRYIMLGSLPDAVQVRVLDAVVADVREQEIARMNERGPLGGDDDLPV